MTISLNVNKGETISLAEKAPSINQIHVGAGWDAAKEGQTIDCDLFAVLRGADGKPFNGAEGVIYFGNKSHASGAVNHSGDNLTGEGDGDDEVITVDLSKIPADVASIRFAITIYQAASKGQNFSQIDNEFIRLVNKETNEEVLKFGDDADLGAVPTFVAADLVRNGDGWDFVAIGEGSNEELNGYVNQLATAAQ